MPLLSLENVGIHFVGPPLLEDVNLQIEQGQRICLVGRNGVGKTTLMRLIDGELEPDFGQIVRQPGLRIARLDQQVPRGLSGSIADQLAARIADEHAEEPWRRRQQVDVVLSKMNLDGRLQCESLSAGMKRRVLLAMALVREPDLLLLDEPTNHLDLATKEVLVRTLSKFAGTMLFVSHDRTFLRGLANKVLDLSGGGDGTAPKPLIFHGDYPAWVERTGHEAPGVHH